MSYSQLCYHIVFSTKGRRKQLKDQVLPRVCDYIGGIISNLDQILLAANGMPDHLHLAVKFKPTMVVLELVGTIKANSSKWIKEIFPSYDLFAWQDGYAAFSVSYSGLPKVLEYIHGQQVHHGDMTFENELIQLLRKHGIEYDERFVFQ